MMKKNNLRSIGRLGLFAPIWALSIICIPVNAQDSLPYHTIPDYPETYTQGTLLARLADGLGFRYYWATEGLTADDLAYKPGPDNRSIGETLDHIYNLSEVILNTARNVHTDRRIDNALTRDFNALRKATLGNIEQASILFHQVGDFSSYKVGIVRNSGTFTFPFWNLLNGPLEDAVWHCGQVVSLRRAAGNPIPDGVNVFSGHKN